MNEILTNAMAEFTFIHNNLHFIRADWFYAFIPLMLYLILSYNKTSSNKNWHSIIDHNLLPYVLTKSGNKQRRYPLLLIFIATSLCITALAGPVYKKLPQPVYREQSALVVLLDLSQSMNATDVKPSRLSRAKLELLDILKTRKTGQTALIVYAADAFVVTPLTDDNATIANLVPSLETDMMPAQGSNLATALAHTFSLFTQAGIINGDILVITDDINQSHESAIEKVFSQGHRLSIFGIGSAEGAPIPLDGGFLQDNDGAIVIPKLHAGKLQRYASKAGGLYSGLQADGSDTIKLTRLFQSSEVTHDTDNKETNADVWQEEGHWLLLPLLFFAALWARKGWIAVLILFVLPLPQPVHADPLASEKNYLNSKHLWSSPDQKAMKAFNAGNNHSAAEQFTQPEWKASAYYRNGDYQAAVEALENTNHSDGYYNKANALTQLGNYEEAIKAYDKAIALDESNEDAKYNREQVKKALEKQQENSEEKNSEQEDSDNKNSDQQENSDQQDSKKQDSQQQDSQQQDSQQQEGQNQDDKNQNTDSSAQQQNDNQSDEELEKEQKAEKTQDDNEKLEDQQLEQRDAESEKEQQQKEQQQYEEDQKNQDENQSDAKQNNEIEHKESKDKNAEDKPEEIEVNPMEASITEEEKATEQWLKRIPDDPGGLLRRKFLYQYKHIPNQNDDNEPW